jgi:hypothetical protein
MEGHNIDGRCSSLAVIKLLLPLVGPMLALVVLLLALVGVPVLHDPRMYTLSPTVHNGVPRPVIGAIGPVVAV